MQKVSHGYLNKSVMWYDNKMFDILCYIVAQCDLRGVDVTFKNIVVHLLDSEK